jgi:hypothetical protein
VIRRSLPLLSLFLLVPFVSADGPGDNIPDRVRPVPPPGIAIADADRAELQAGAAALGKEIDALRDALKGKPALLGLLPDVQIFHNSVRYALEHNEFYDVKDVAAARAQLKLGQERAKSLRDGQAPWTTATGLVVRGYVSRLDGSVQPYGLVVPASFRPDAPRKHRLDVWCHGRDEKLTELRFLDQRQRSPGEFVAPDTFVLHLYGRYCCANKLAGEVDCFEAVADVEKHYPIDKDRRVIRGFSMGGAACWHLAAHHPSFWAAAAPGAGFSETPDFLKVFQNEDVQPTWYEKALFHWYDCTDYAGNFFNLPVVAYSGEKDKQKQAADVMGVAMQKEGLNLIHIIGPNTGHSYEAEAKKELIRRIDALAARGRNAVPREIRFTTWTLRYNRSFWVTIDGLERHWQRADVEAGLKEGGASLRTHNVSAMTLSFGPAEFPLPRPGPAKVDIDGAALESPPVQSDRSWIVHLRKVEGAWKVVPSPTVEGPAKVHGLQGPIDDAFLDSFLVVRPTGKALHEKTGAWVEAELKRALVHWRKQFRGEARVKDDKDVTDADIAAHNLILWGDPASNQVLAKVLGKLPLQWDAQGLKVGGEGFASADAVPLLIYPNPLNPQRYVVLNSGFTFRDYDYLNNARQIAKLPDWAVVDVRTPPNARWPGKVAAAGFFDERWWPVIP